MGVVLMSEHDERIVAGTEMLGHLGSSSFEMRYSEPELKNSPTVWIAIAHFDNFAAPPPPQVAAGLAPLHALEKLLENLIDGGTCQHCGKPTLFYKEHTEMTEIALFCAYVYDPELKKYRRGCEGDD